MKRCLWFVLIGLIIASIISISCSQTPVKIRVATDATSPPFTYIDEQTGQNVGFDIDLMNAIAGKENLKIEFISVDFKSLLEGTAQNKYDAAISAISITEGRQKDMLFSDLYFVSGLVVTVRKDDASIIGKDNLADKVVGVETGSTGAASISDMPDVTVKDYIDLSDAFDDLMNGMIDAVVTDNTIASSYVASYPDKLKIVGTPFSQENYGIAVAKNKPELLEKINAGLKAIKSDGLLEELTQKWLPR